MNEIKWFFDWLIPRFLTEWVVLVDEGEHLMPLCAVQDLDEWEFRPDMVFQKWKTFNLFGYGVLPKAVGDSYQVNSYSDLESLMKL